VNSTHQKMRHFAIFSALLSLYLSLLYSQHPVARLGIHPFNPRRVPLRWSFY